MPSAALSMAGRAEDKARRTGRVDPTEIWLIAQEIGNRYARKLGEDAGQQIMVATAEATIRNYDPSRGVPLITFMNYRASEAATRSADDGMDPAQARAKRTLKTWMKMYKKEMGEEPTTLRSLAEFLSAKGELVTLEDVQQVRDTARRGKTLSLELSTSGGTGEEDEQTIAETVTASASIGEEEGKIVAAREAAAMASTSAEMNLEERKFVEQFKRGFSVADIAKRMGISKSKAFEIKKKVVAHLGGTEQG
jgi:DNA-directed RNA polymerase specialized sigma subunit